MKNFLYDLQSSDPEEFQRIVERLRQTFQYCPDTGLIVRLKSAGRARKGDLAGHKNSRGYLHLGFEGRKLLCHHVAHVIYTGFAVLQLDHRDLDRENNSWLNLRKATNAENSQNTKSKSEHKNVYWVPEKSRYRVSFKIGGMSKHFGYYDTLEEAVKVANTKREELHGEFARG